MNISHRVLSLEVDDRRSPAAVGRARIRAQAGAIGMIMIELVVALAIITTVALPIAFNFAQEQRAARAQYFRAVAMEIVDGEMEILLAGEWQKLAQGEQSYFTRAESATNLPPGRFVVSLNGQTVRLEWRPAKYGRGGPVSRTAQVPGRTAPM